jgi:chemotaxis signal transduction protein
MEQIPDHEHGGPIMTLPLLSLFDGERAFQARMPALREVVAAASITPVPYMPAFIRGVMPYGNTTIPVIDFQADPMKNQEQESPGACVLVFSYGQMEFGVVMEKACEQARKSLKKSLAPQEAPRDKRRVWSSNAWW